ncbi:MAG: 3-keto-disaccharide hydrolase, partial [Thermoguttaceae bacterium]
MRNAVLLASALLLLLPAGLTLSPLAAAEPAQASDLPATDAPAAPAQFVELFNGRDLSGWVNVNTAPDTWSVKDSLLVCSGKPIGVMRSEKQYENFVLHIEWRHMEAGGNSGVFVWSEGSVPAGSNLPKGMEVQMLELDWVNLHRAKDGGPQHIGYISGELFGAGGMTATPDNPRGTRSMSRELRCKGKGQWNVYDVVCVDGTVKLAI